MSDRKRKRRTRDNGIIKPSRDSKSYEPMTLENGLTVLLISDPDATVSSASMAVRVGSLDDPVEIQGLAHLVEHLVFRGSPQFPGDNELKRYLAEHDGEANANTEVEHSIFSMEVDSSYLKRSLSRFAHLFIEPSFKIEAIDGEIKAMNSEFELSRNTDRSRLDQLRGHTSPSGHPFTKFSWGNKESFSTSKLDMNSIRDHALKLFGERYIGHSMKLVVLGNERVGVLRKWVSEFFSGVKKGTKSISKLDIPSPFPFWNKLFLLEAVEDSHLLDVSWMIPSKPRGVLFLNQPELYLIKVLSHRCKGSLYSFFKDKGWATSIAASSGASGDNEDAVYNSTSAGRLFTLSFDLTDIGVVKKYELVDYIYQYLQLLRNKTDPYVMQEFRLCKEMQFEYLDTDGLGADPSLFTQRLAANFLGYPLKHVLSVDYLHHVCTTKLIEELLEYLTPDNMRIDLVSKSLKSEEFDIEPWFNSNYIEEEIPASYKEKWIHVVEVDPSLCLPPKNSFLPFQFIVEEGEEEEEQIVDNSYISMWYRREECIPNVNVSIYVNVADDMKSHLMAELFVILLKDSLSEILYQGEEAWLTTSLSLSEYNKLTFKVKGYRETLRSYISKIWEQFVSFLPTSANQFKMMKECMSQDLSNSTLDIEKQSDQLLLEITTKGYHSVEDKLELLKTVTLDELNQFIHTLRSQIFIEGIVFGDLLKEQAKKISTLLEKTSIERVGIPRDKIGRKNTVHIPREKTLRKNVKVKLNSEVNSSVKVYFQMGKSKDDSSKTALSLLFNSMIEEKLSYQLRIKENLGYEIGCQHHFIGGINGFSITVVSPEYNPIYLLSRINKFIESCPTLLEAVDDEAFRRYKKIVRSNVQVSCGEEIWDQINEKKCWPGFDCKVSQKVKLLKKEDVFKFHDRYLRESSPRCRKAVLSIWGCNTLFPHSTS